MDFVNTNRQGSYLCPEAIAAEEARIRKVYGERKNKASYAGLYSCFNPGHLFILQEREQRILKLLARYGCEDLRTKRLLEIGCGNGQWLREFIKWGAQPENVVGMDLLEDRVAEASRLCPSDTKIELGSAAELAFIDESFDLVLQATVFTSILDASLKRRIASEMMRVTKPEGLILWYDYHVNNPWNGDVRGLRRREIKELFPDCRIELSRVTLAPPVTRLLAPYSYLACYLLGKIPALCTHYLGVIRKR
jgi:ubiquinone/menaquinone biosynthesis C-methylase UbiE